MKLGNLSEKQRIALRDSTARLNFWIGAVRSGKSFSALLRFMQLCTDKTIDGDFVIVGKSEGAIKRNIVSEMHNLVGDDCRYSPGNREIQLYNRKIHVVGANDLRSEGKIRGSSFGCALIDEVTIIPENFFTMLLSRLSKNNAKLLGTTNPDSPFNWFKTKYLDRADELGAKVFNFYLDDNPSLSIEYKDSLKKEFTGLYYDRFILGKWVLSSGSIYDFFDEKIHVIQESPAQGNYYVCGIDYGVTNACAFVLMGYNNLTFPNCWVEKEYYYDSKVALKQKTDAEYARDLAEFLNGYYVRAISVDPSATSFKLELMRSGMSNIINADNDVLLGIRTASTMLQQGTVKICDCCPNLIKEIQSYVWDEAAALKGIERPKKFFDHAVDGFRYACLSISKFIAGNNNTEYESSFSSMNSQFINRI